MARKGHTGPLYFRAGCLHYLADSRGFLALGTKPDMTPGNTLTPLVWLAGYDALTLSDTHVTAASHLANSNARCNVPTPPLQPYRPEQNGHAKGLAGGLAVTSGQRCPNCGAANAVVFPRMFFGVGPRPKHPPLVCFACFARIGGVT
jgi:hypothetical protein